MHTILTNSDLSIGFCFSHLSLYSFWVSTARTKLINTMRQGPHWNEDIFILFFEIAGKI
jgi:hypothetical protein